MPGIDMDLASGIAAFEAKEFRRAMQLLSPLAEQGEPEAQFRVAVMYQNGLGAVRNEPNAFHWMRAAAEQAHGLAQHAMGVMYLYGECVEKNETTAAGWFFRAAEQKLPGAMAALAMMYGQGVGVEKDLARAQQLYELAGLPNNCNEEGAR